MDDSVPLYNSRITKVYLRYLKSNYPDLDVDSLLQYAGMTNYEVDDSAHWFTQNQVDRFNRIVIEKTGNREIPREAGRFSFSSEVLGAVKQHLIGLMSLASVYLLMERLYLMMSRAADVKAKKIGNNKVEIVSTPREGVQERPFQCDYRLGSFESVAKLFTNEYGQIEHPLCIHNGDSCCRYIITWEITRSLIWKRLRNFFILFSALACLIFFFLLPLQGWLDMLLISILSCMTISSYSEHVEKKELAKTIVTQGNAAQDLLNEMNIRYNNALLVQEIGHATSTILDIVSLSGAVLNAIEKRLHFDRGMIMLANNDKSRLLFSAGYGYTEKEEGLLRGTQFHLDRPESKGIFVLGFREQKPFLINDISEIEGQFSVKSRELAREMGVSALICVPIVYEKESLGILAVEDIRSKRTLTQSDISLLMGVASQMAVSIINARSFQRLKQSEDKYRTILESIEEGYFEVDLQGHFTFFNDSICKMTGYSKNELLGMHYRDYTTPEMSKKIQSNFNEVNRTGNPVELADYEIKRKDESIGILELTASLMKDTSDRPVGFRGLVRDVTQRKLAEKEMKKLEVQLQQAQKMEAVGTLAGGIAHDFNNILQTIFSYTQILLMKMNQSDPEYEKLGIIEKSVRRASDLTRRLLIFSRRVDTKLDLVDLNEEVVHVSKMLERMIPKMIRIELHLAGDLKAIRADVGQMEQILMNLGVNARDAMPEGGRLVFRTENVILDEEFCKTHLVARPGEFILMSIADTGHGMDKGIMEHIFEPFFTTKETGKGTGLGLAMVYGIVKNHSGFITCKSAPGEGATFDIYFPAATQQLKSEVRIEKETPIPRGSETILLVDDEQTIRDLGKEILTEYGYRVMAAHDGESALEHYKRSPTQIDLVILDLIMPGMGGRRCLEELFRVNSRIKVVIASGYSVDGYTKEMIDKWTKGFIHKPYEVKQMLREVRKVLDA